MASMPGEWKQEAQGEHKNGQGISIRTTYYQTVKSGREDGRLDSHHLKGNITSRQRSNGRLLVLSTRNDATLHDINTSCSYLVQSIMRERPIHRQRPPIRSYNFPSCPRHQRYRYHTYSGIQHRFRVPGPSSPSTRHPTWPASDQAEAQ